MLKSTSDSQATKLQAKEAQQSNTLGCFKFWQEKEMAMENTKQPLFKKNQFTKLSKQASNSNSHSKRFTNDCNLNQ